jgi:sugar lactone lactonase YvrE
VWRISTDTGQADGIDAHGGRLFIANMEQGLIVVAQINGRSHRSQPTVYATVDGGPDGLEVDSRGRPHVVLIDQNAVVNFSIGEAFPGVLEPSDVGPSVVMFRSH